MPSYARIRLSPQITRLATLALLLPAVLIAVGCHQSPRATPPAQVRLHNDAPHAVSARIVHVGVADSKTLMRRTLGPGATDTLGPIPTPTRGSLQLVLEPADRDDFILRAPIPVGLTAYHVGRPFILGRLALDPQAVNPDWTFAGGFMTEHQLQAIAEYDAAPLMQRRATVDVEMLDQP
ncbi:MAG: hypothetical protein ACI89L_000591 [Phycisphaerales bacterium]|jgi:hypothetical protein